MINEQWQAKLLLTQAELERRQSRLLELQKEIEASLNVVVRRETNKSFRTESTQHKVKVNLFNSNQSIGQLLLKGQNILRHEGSLALVRRTARFILSHLGVRSKVDYTETFTANPSDLSADASEYAQWIEQTEPKKEELEKQAFIEQSLAYRPLLSIIIPVYKLPSSILEDTINSVLKQTYSNWELCITFADINNQENLKYLKELEKKEQRVKLSVMPKNLGISGNSNAALELASGYFILLLDHDDKLALSALFTVVTKLNQQPDLDFLYSDKDCISADGKTRSRFLFKPEWSPETLYSANYLTHLCVIRRELVVRIGGFRPETDGAQDWDLFLRVTEQTSKIARVEGVLYHWRLIEGSTSIGIESKPYALEAQLRTIKDHLVRQNIPAIVTPHAECGFHIQWTVSPKKVLLIIDGDVPWKTLCNCLQKLSLSDNPSLNQAKIVIPESTYYLQKSEIIAVGKHSKLPLDWLVVGKSESKTQVLAKAALSENDPDVVIFLSGGVKKFGAKWIKELSDWVTGHPDIGFASALVLTEQDIVAEAGLVVDRQGNGHSVFRGRYLYNWETFGGALWYRNCSASSPFAVAFSFQHYLAIGGLPKNELSFQRAMIKLCQASCATGKRGLVNPHARVFLNALETNEIPEFDESVAKDPYFHSAFGSIAPLKLKLQDRKN